MDSFFGIGMPELILIAVIALIVLGPERIPGAMREVAKWARQVRDISNELQNQFSDEIKMLDEINPRKLMNEALDPKANATPGAAALPSTAPTAAPGTALSTGINTAPVNSAGVSVANGEPSNSILPPRRMDSSAPAQPGADGATGALPPAGSPADPASPAEPPAGGDAPGQPTDGAPGVAQ